MMTKQARKLATRNKNEYTISKANRRSYFLHDEFLLQDNGRTREKNIDICAIQETKKKWKAKENIANIF